MTEPLITPTQNPTNSEILGKLHVDLAGHTDTGDRDQNEDQFLIARLHKSAEIQQSSLSIPAALQGRPQVYLMGVADGIGGAEGGQRASAVAMTTVLRHVLDSMPWFFRQDQASGEDLRTALKLGLAKASAYLRQEGTTTPALSDMGTTLTLGYLLWPRLHLVHLGDSRAYLLRSGELRQLTRDHTVAQLMADEGQPARTGLDHMLWNALSANGEVPEPDIHELLLIPGDCMLFCSDGLTNEVEDSELAAHLAQAASAQAAATSLVDLACERGSNDNVTAVVARFALTGHPLN